MKLIISAVTWDGALKAGMSQRQLAELAVELGCVGVEFRQYWHNQDGDIEETAAAIRKHNLVCTYAANSGLLAETQEKTEQALAAVKNDIAIADRLGAKLLRINIAGGAFDQAFITAEWWLAGVRKLLDVAAAKGITIAAENGPDVLKSNLAVVEKVLSQVNSPWLKLTFDTGNWLYANVRPEVALEKLLPYIGYVHLKDIITKGDGLQHGHLGAGIVDVRGVALKLAQTGYNGIFALEFPGGNDPVARVKESMSYLKR